MEGAKLDELRSGLELATPEELQQLTDILFSRRFNPLDYLHTPHPIDVKSRDRQAWIDALEQRFRFLAADGITVLRGKTGEFTYRQALIQVCRYLKICYSHRLSTTDLEAEVFLNLLGKAWTKLPKNDQEVLNHRVKSSLAQSNYAIPLEILRDPISLLVKGGSALALSSVIKPILLQEMARRVAIQFAQYQIAREALLQGSVVGATQFQKYVAVQTAKRGMAVSAARYGAVRTMINVLGPILWTWFLADLGWRAIATNYVRIIPTIFALAQIRLIREECWEMA